MGSLDLFHLNDQVSIVTGGGTGLGFTLAKGLAEAGSQVVICSRKEENCIKAAKKIGELGVHAVGYKCNITDPNDITTLKNAVLKEFGKIDILINNAGATWGAPTETYPINGWKKVIEVNVTGTFLCSQIIGKTMIKNGGGKIVNISSIFGTVGAASQVMDAIAYNTSKGAIEAFTKDLAAKWAKYNIYVNAIAPAFIETEMTRITMERGREAILNHLPIKRFGIPEDLKGAAVFLCSAASDYITGTILHVDGGYRAV